MTSPVAASRLPLADITSNERSVSNILGSADIKTQKQGSLLRSAFPSSPSQIFSSTSVSSLEVADLFNYEIPSIECTEVELKALQKIAETAPKGFFRVVESIVLRNMHLLSQKSMESAPKVIIHEMKRTQIQILKRFNDMVSIESVFKNGCDFIDVEDSFILNAETDNHKTLNQLFDSELTFISGLIKKLEGVSSDSQVAAVTITTQRTHLLELQVNLQILEKLSRLNVQDLESLSFKADKKCVRSESEIEQGIDQLISVYEHAIKDKKVVQLFKEIISKLKLLRIQAWDLKSIESFYKALPALEDQIIHIFSQYKELIDAEKSNPSAKSQARFNRVINSACQVLMMENFIQRALKSILYFTAHTHQEKKFREFSKYAPHCLQSLQLADQLDLDHPLEELSWNVNKIHQKFICILDQIFESYSEGKLSEYVQSIKETLDDDQDPNLRLYQFYSLRLVVDRIDLSENLKSISNELEEALIQLISNISRAQSKIDKNELESLKSHIFAQETYFRALLHVISGLHAYLLATNSNDQSLSLDSISEFKGFEGTSLFLNEKQISLLNELLRVFSPTEPTDTDELIFEMDGV